MNQSFDNPKNLYITLDTNSPFLEKRRVGDRVSLTTGWHEASGTSSSSGSCASPLSTKFYQGIRQTWTLCDPPQNRMSISTSQHDFLSKRLLVVFLSHHFSIKQLSKNKIHLSLPPFSPRVSRWESENQPTKQNLHLHHSSRNQSTTGPHHRCEKSWGKTFSWNFFSPQAPQYFWSPIASRSVEGGVIAKDVPSIHPRSQKWNIHKHLTYYIKRFTFGSPFWFINMCVRLHLPSGGFSMD